MLESPLRAGSVRIGDSAAATRALIVANLGIGWGLDHADACPIGVEFFCQNHRQGSARTLSHFGAMHRQGHGSVAVNLHKKIWLKRCLAWQQRRSCRRRAALGRGVRCRKKN